MKIPEKMNERIRFLRTQHGYTQQEIINNLGVGKSAYSMYENGERTISVEIVAKLAQLYNVSTDFIIGLTNNTKSVTSSVDSYLNDEAIKTITKMGNSNDKRALAALNTLLSDSQCYKIFTSLYKVLYMPMIASVCINAYASQESHEFKAKDEAKAKYYLKDLLGLSEIAPDYSDDILEKIALEIGINTKQLSKETRNIAKMLFMTQIENFIERNLSPVMRNQIHRNIRKSILSEE